MSAAATEVGGAIAAAGDVLVGAAEATAADDVLVGAAEAIAVAMRALKPHAAAASALGER